MDNPIELLKWKCDACGEAENCEASCKMELYAGEPTVCPISGDDCEWYSLDTRAALEQPSTRECRKTCEVVKDWEKATADNVELVRRLDALERPPCKTCDDLGVVVEDTVTPNSTIDTDEKPCPGCKPQKRLCEKNDWNEPCREICGEFCVLWLSDKCLKAKPPPTALAEELRNIAKVCKDTHYDVITKREAILLLDAAKELNRLAALLNTDPTEFTSEIRCLLSEGPGPPSEVGQVLLDSMGMIERLTAKEKTLQAELDKLRLDYDELQAICSKCGEAE